MNYNNGQSYNNFFSASAEVKGKLAKDFSEGNLKLEKLLIDMWDNGIKTNSCCNGHDDGRSWFLSFEVDENSKQVVNDLINIVGVVDSDSIELDFYPIKDKLSLSVNSSSEYKDFLLHFMHSSVTNRKSYFENDILNNVTYIEKLAKRLNLDYRFAMNKGEMAFALYPKGSMVFFSGDMPNIADVRNGGFQFRPYKCDSESLKTFLSQIYPEINKGNGNGK